MQNTPEIEIQTIGNFFETDNEGYIINPTTTEKIQEEYKPVLEDIIKLYQQEYENKLISVYIRGSVVKGTAISGIADIDTFAFVDDISENLPRKWKELRENFGINKKYPQFDDIEMGATPFNDIERKYKILLHQSVAIYGSALPVAKKKISSEFAMHAPRLDRRLEKFDNIFSEGNLTTSNCTWFMKTLLRTGLELTLDRAHKYSRDLYPCYQIFSEYYPEKESEMKEVLYLTLNPTDDKKILKRIRNGFAQWLLEETKNHKWKIYE